MKHKKQMKLVFKDENFVECLKWKYKLEFIEIDEGWLIISTEEFINNIKEIECKCYEINNIVWISMFKNLEVLVLEENQIEELSEEIWDLKNLKILDLSDNQIKELPKEIWKLEKLKELYLWWNKIKELPKEIWNLTKLEYLGLSSNQLQRLPKEIWNLKNLKKLYLRWNKLQELPKEIGKLKNLEDIFLEDAFDLDNLKQDPKELLDILKRLEENYKFEIRSKEYLKEKVYPVLEKKIKKE